MANQSYLKKRWHWTCCLDRKFSVENTEAIAKKFHLFWSPFVDKAINTPNFTTTSRYAETLLGITIDSNLGFSERIMYLFVSANRKLHALSSVSVYISVKSVVCLWSHSLFPNSIAGFWFGWHISESSTMTLIIFTKSLCAS